MQPIIDYRMKHPVCEFTFQFAEELLASCAKPIPPHTVLLPLVWVCVRTKEARRAVF
jgi:hypothetical protein